MEMILWIDGSVLRNEEKMLYLQTSLFLSVLKLQEQIKLSVLKYWCLKVFLLPCISISEDYRMQFTC